MNSEALIAAQFGCLFTFEDAIMQEVINAILCSDAPDKFSIEQVKDIASRIANDGLLNQILDDLIAEEIY